jgi:hypothetical protein
VNSKIQFPTGISCVFVPIHPKTGAKLFLDVYNRNHAWHLQKKAAAKKLAPLVGARFSLSWANVCALDGDSSEVDIQRITIYGYLTELVDTRRKSGHRQRDKLVKSLQDIGISAFDLHDENVGWVGKNLVCIDFDFCSACKNEDMDEIKEEQALWNGYTL